MREMCKIDFKKILCVFCNGNCFFSVNKVYVCIK